MSSWTNVYRVPAEFKEKQELDEYDVSCVCLHYSSENLIWDVQGYNVAIEVSELLGIPTGGEHAVSKGKFMEGRHKFQGRMYVGSLREKLSKFFEEVCPAIEKEGRVVVEFC